MIVLGEKVCDKRVEDAKPSFWDKMGWRIEGMGILGVIVAIGALAL